MKFKAYIQNLQNTSAQVELEQIHWWLKNYENEFYKAITNSNCGKWEKWLYKGEIPFPCCCAIKEKGCAFIELYYNLDKLTKENNPDLFYINNVIKSSLNYLETKNKKL